MSVWYDSEIKKVSLWVSVTVPQSNSELHWVGTHGLFNFPQKLSAKNIAKTECEILATQWKNHSN